MREPEQIVAIDGFGDEPDIARSAPAPESSAAGRRPVWLRVVILAWPVWVQQLLLMAVGLYDQFLAGNNTPDDRALHVPYQAAQTTANYLSWFISSSSALVCVGSTALVARFVGAGEKRQAVHAANQSITLAIGFGLAGTVVGLLLVRRVVHWMGTVGPAEEMAVEFLIPLLSLLVFQMIESAGLACLVGAGDTQPTLWVLGGIALINMPLAWVCFHGLGPIPKISYPGIALGTALSHMLGGLAVLAMLARGRAGLKLSWPELFPDARLMRRLSRISIPASVDTLSLGACQLWFLTMVNHLGDVAAAAHGIAIRWESLGYLSGYPFATAAAALVGQNLGAGRVHEAARSGWISWAIGLGLMCTMGGIFFLLAPDMFALFCPDADQKPVIEAGVPVLRLVAFAMPSLACIIVFTGCLRGAGDTRVPLLLTWIGFLVIRIPLAYFLMYPRIDLGPFGDWAGAGLGLYGAWLSMFADLFVRGFLFLWRFGSGRWKRTRV